MLLRCTSLEGDSFCKASPFSDDLVEGKFNGNDDSCRIICHSVTDKIASCLLAGTATDCVFWL